ncbi:MAG: TonB-dependent receptor plug domain-containing protein [Bacteroidales bacterium]|nr:TonB-dependent receptor plug domain-containing protein [Bacteroidales bacterium]
MRKITTFLVVLFFASNLVYGQTVSDTTKLNKESNNIPTFTLTQSDLSSEDEGQEDISGLLQASRDVFVSTAGYVFGPARFRIRGYDTRNISVMMNGVPMSDPTTGRAYFSSWGGLNDVTRNQIIQFGVASSPVSFGGVGGVTDIITRPSTFRKQTSVSYALSNRSYNNRVAATYSTGQMTNGWSFVFSGSHRWAQQGYVEGTFYDAWAYFIGVEKKINKNQSLSFTAFSAPTKRASAGMAVQEAYDLTGNNFYNPYWGYQDGKVRNSRISQYNQPMLTLTHYWNISEKTKSQASVSYWFGRGGSTSLNWVEANDPRPDYYRNLPSWYAAQDNTAMADYYTQMWENDPAFRQINWDAMYFANSKYLFTVNNVDGTGNSVTGNRSKYILEDRRNDKSQFQFDWHFTSFVNDNITVSGGVETSWFRGHQFKTVADLLGGDYWLDIDKFAETSPLGNTDAAQSDLNHPNRIVRVGDIFGYNYYANINTQTIHGEADFNYGKVDFFVGMKLSHTTFWRTGLMKNGLFPDNSYGDSPKNSFSNYGLKAGLTYKIDGRNYIVLDGMTMTQAPYFRDAYVSPRTRDFIVNPLKNEQIYSADLSYILRSPTVKARITAYYAQFKDQTFSRSFYHDVLATFVNYIMTGVDKQSMGLEFGLEANVTPTITVNAMAGLGQYIYNSNPSVTIVQDNNSNIIATDRTVYFKNYYVGGMPQTIASVGFRYNDPKYWFIGINGNYFGGNYLEPNPDRRTAEALAGMYEGDIRIDPILEMTELPSATTFDFFGGKSWRLQHKYTLGLTLSINNLLNNKNIPIFGYEQLRYDPTDINKYPPKYAYMYGTTFFLNIYLRM